LVRGIKEGGKKEKEGQHSPPPIPYEGSPKYRKREEGQARETKFGRTRKVDDDHQKELNVRLAEPVGGGKGTKKRPVLPFARDKPSARDQNSSGKIRERRCGQDYHGRPACVFHNVDDHLGDIQTEEGASEQGYRENT